MARFRDACYWLLFSAIAGLHYTGTASGQASGDGWVTLFDGKKLDQWQGEAGNNATWRIEDGSIAVDKRTRIQRPSSAWSRKQSSAISNCARVLGQRTMPTATSISVAGSQKANSQDRLRGQHLRSPAPIRASAPVRSSMWPRPQNGPETGGKWTPTRCRERLDVHRHPQRHQTVDVRRTADFRRVEIAPLSTAKATVKFRKVQIKPL